MGKSTVIWGAGGHAKVVADILNRTGFCVAGLIDDIDPSRRVAFFGSIHVLGDNIELPRIYAAGIQRSIVGFGENARRIAAGEVLESLGFELVCAIHPSAIMALHTSVAPGSVIAAGAVIGPSTIIGKSAIVNTRASVDHDCFLDEGVHVAPGVTIAGHVEIGKGAFIGAGATIINGKRIGAGTIIAAGSVVIDDVPDRTLVAGVPARIVRNLDSSRS